MSDDRAFSILYVDCEPQHLLTFRYALEERFSLLTAETGTQALALLARHEVAVLVCDQRMPGMTGIELCARARQLKPDVARILMTARSDLQTAVDAINQGHVFRYLTKPLHLAELMRTLDCAVDLVRMRRTISTLQARVLRGSEPPVLEGVLRQVAAELDAPVGRLGMGNEQVADLLDAGLGAWDDAARARQLVEHARNIHAEAERPIAELMAVVRRLERGQRLVPLPPPASCDVGRVARAAVHIVRSTLDPSIMLRLSLAAAPAADIDAIDLGQTLLHLITHAACAVEQTDERTIEVDVRDGATGVELSVSSTGPAVRSEQLARIFDPYFVVVPGASGIGLAMAKQLVERAGGHVGAEELPAGGIRFVVHLPSRAALSLG